MGILNRIFNRLHKKDPSGKTGGPITSTSGSFSSASLKHHNTPGTLKANCRNCGATILYSRFSANKGLCAPCSKGPDIAERRRQMKVLQESKADNRKKEYSSHGTESSETKSIKKTTNEHSYVLTRAGTPRHPKDSVLRKLINMGALTNEAGSREVGYFNPDTLIFVAIPNGMLMLGIDSEVEEQLALMEEAKNDPFVLSTIDLTASGKTSDHNPLVTIAIKLRISSAEEILKQFRATIKDQSIGAFLMATTVMPFFLQYTEPAAGKVRVIGELSEELMLNALANLLLQDPAFANVHSVQILKKVASSLIEIRKDEYEKKKQWESC